MWSALAAWGCRAHRRAEQLQRGDAAIQRHICHPLLGNTALSIQVEDNLGSMCSTTRATGTAQQHLQAIRRKPVDFYTRAFPARNAG